ncbi:MAG: hypothetical protein SCM96_12180 [Acidobacteriota bacterium]|nr:hypothetical protein [Acidobacteriota bacterium]
MNKTSFLRMGIPAVLVFAAASCIIAVVEQGAGGSFRADRTFNRTLDFETGGTVSLEHEAGVIEITGWDRNELEISAEKIGSGNARGGIRVAALRLDRKPDILIEREGNSVRISRRPSWRDEPEDEIDYRIRVPRPVNLEPLSLEKGEIWISDLFGRVVLDIEQGNVDIENYSGSIEAEVGSGSVRAEVLDFREEDYISIRVENGDIVLFLQPDVRAEIRAEAPGGTISGEFDFEGEHPLSEIDGRLGGEEAAAQIYLRSTLGSIRILKADPPDSDRIPGN